tara:strand:- start:12199 stop:12339 length:141 start_codon:yes stop_codon:yes gene_type:complete
MDVLAREYGWTPADIRALPISDVMAFWRIITMRRDIEQARAKKAGR